ncbi:DUF1540 domain-containing protein [Oscillospiraceae bacterium OttesenSCG-928-F05]|nr:DUF1540 domain-containing protein [Oscillospiraceae bacterium OttesenSCG-928-F05]
MFGSNGNNNKIDGVVCSVDKCSYHSAGNICTANRIRVGTEYASRKDETFCNTFECKH